MRYNTCQQIGDGVCSGLHNEKPSAHAIFDSESYESVYKGNLQEANKSIVMSNPAISVPKGYELIDRLKQVLGVEVTIVTWSLDSSGYGDSAFWTRVHEDMRQADFCITTVAVSCEHFVIIDQELVWYGKWQGKGTLWRKGTWTYMNCIV